MPTVDIFNIQKEKVGELDLKDEIFGVEVKGAVLHEVVTWQRACRRAGSASTKSRGEVRGGGIAFGPKPRSYAYTLPKKVRRLALRMALSSKLADGQLVVLDSYPHTTPKTRDFVAVLQAFAIDKALFVTPGENRALELSARNVPGVQVMLPQGLNVYDILKYDHLVLLSPALEAIEARLAK